MTTGAKVRMRLLVPVPDDSGAMHEVGELIRMDRPTALHCIIEKIAEPCGWSPSPTELVEQCERDVALLRAELERRRRTQPAGN